MIVISRLEGEGVVIGDLVTITVVEIQGEDVILRFEPRDGAKLELGEGDDPAQLTAEWEETVTLCTSVALYESRYDVFS